MAGFLYFIPGLTGEDKAVIAPLGLYDRCSPGGLVTAPVPRGPTGGDNKTLAVRGLLVAASVAPTKTPLRLTDGWRWAPVRIEDEDKIGYWIGFDPVPDKRPGPADLVRPAAAPLPCVPVTLGDGRTWDIPVALRPSDGIVCNLPMQLKYDADGVEVYDIEADYTGLWEMALETTADICNAFEPASDEDEDPASPETDSAVASDETAKSRLSRHRISEILTAALAVNYRIGRPELIALELMNDSTNGDAMAALCGFSDYCNCNNGDKKKT